MDIGKCKKFNVKGGYCTCSWPERNLPQAALSEQEPWPNCSERKRKSARSAAACEASKANGQIIGQRQSFE